MSKPISSRLVIRVLEEKGFLLISQRGSHAKFRKAGKLTRTVIVKVSKKEIPYGTFQSILLQSNLKKEDFKKK